MIFTPEELFHISLAYHFVRRTYLKGTSPWDLILSKPGKFVNPMHGLNTSVTAIVEKYKALPPISSLPPHSPLPSEGETTEGSPVDRSVTKGVAAEGTARSEGALSEQVGQSQFDKIMQEFITRRGMLAHYNRMVSLSKDPDYILFLQLRDETMRWLVNTVKNAIKTAQAAQAEETTAQTAEKAAVGTAAQTAASIEPASILSRLDKIIRLCGTATEMNETDFSIEVKRLLKEAGLYKSQWDYLRSGELPPIQVDEETHNLITAIIAKLKGIPDGGAELFPFELIDSWGRLTAWILKRLKLTNR